MAAYAVVVGKSRVLPWNDGCTTALFLGGPPELSTARASLGCSIMVALSIALELTDAPPGKRGRSPDCPVDMPTADDKYLG